MWGSFELLAGACESETPGVGVVASGAASRGGARESLLARDWDGLPLVLLVRGGAARGAAALPRCGARRAGGRAAARVVGVQVAGPGLRLRP